MVFWRVAGGPHHGTPATSRRCKPLLAGVSPHTRLQNVWHLCERKTCMRPVRKTCMKTASPELWQAVLFRTPTWVGETGCPDDRNDVLAILNTVHGNSFTAHPNILRPTSGACAQRTREHVRASALAYLRAAVGLRNHGLYLSGATTFVCIATASGRWGYFRSPKQLRCDSYLD